MKRAAVTSAFMLGLLLTVPCTSDSGDPTLTPPPATASPTLFAATSTTSSPSPIASPTTPGPPTATVLRNGLQVWPWPMNEATSMGTLARGDTVVVDAQRFGWVQLETGGWITAHPEFTELSVELATLATLEAPTHSPATRTGDPQVDRVIDAALSVDVDALVQLAAFQDTPCVDDGDTGAFVCRDGMAAGTEVPVFGFTGCHGNPTTEAETRTEFERWSRDTIGLYAVYGAAPETVVLLTRDGAALIAALTADGQIRHIDYGCGQHPPEWVARLVTDFVLAPVEIGAARLYGFETRTGITIVDALLDARTDSAVRPPAALTEIPCTSQSAGRPGEPPCPDGVPAGSDIPVFPTATCEPSFLFDQETAEAQISQALSRGRLQLYAVVEVLEPNLQTGPARYAVTLAHSVDDATAPTFFLSEQAIVGMRHGCGLPADGARQVGPFIIPPITGS